MAKRSIRMSKQLKAEYREKSEQHYMAQQAKGSTGSEADLCERIIADMLNKDGITTTGGMFKQGFNRADVRVKDSEGNWVNVEVKHGGGAIAYAFLCGKEKFDSRDRDDCLIGADWVVYHLQADHNRARTKMVLEYRVSTREDFLDMLEEYCHGPRSAGFQTATKFSKDGVQINIQSAYIKQFWAGLQDDPRAMILWDFCTDILGRDPRWDW